MAGEVRRIDELRLLPQIEILAAATELDGTYTSAARPFLKCFTPGGRAPSRKRRCAGGRSSCLSELSRKKRRPAIGSLRFHPQNQSTLITRRTTSSTKRFSGSRISATRLTV